MNLFKSNKYFLIISLVMTMAILLPLASCKDELLYNPSEIGEGETDIDVSITFYESIGNLTTRDGEDESEDNVSGGISGNAISGNKIGNVSSLCVLLYQKEQEGTSYKLIKRFPQDKLKEYNYQQTNNSTATDAVGTNSHKAENQTGKASFKLTDVPYGKYHIFAVANMGDLSKYQEEIKTEDGLKNIMLDWDSEIAENNQMFGFFTVAKETVSENKSDGFTADEIVINNTDISLHAWLKRVVSKVTVAFDASNLKDDIKIYIKSVEIKDIPENCFLGADNPGTPDNTEGGEGKEIAFSNRIQQIIYNTGLTGTPDDSWTQYISKQHPILGADPQAINSSESIDKQLESQHGPSVKSFFFFENLQGKGKAGTESDKRQDVSGNNKTVSYPEGVNQYGQNETGEQTENKAWKDAKKYGSYIEVKAYYISKNAGDLGQGDIIYRFMLGQDILTDYNAKRNYHYKLTLCFNGYANDIDWHIDYKPIPDIYVPDPYYISYLEGASTELPVNVTGDFGTIKKLKLEIVENNWIPSPNGEPTANYYKAFWNPQNEDLHNTHFDNANFVPTEGQYNNTMQPENGFLSLEKELVLSKEYNVEPGSYGYVEDGYKQDSYNGYLVEEKNQYTRIFKIALFAKTANQFVGYQKEAKVNIIALDANDNVVVKKEFTMIQVRRLVNPTGIYRDWNESEPFDVQLLDLDEDYTTDPWTDQAQFKLFESDGPWFAEIMASGGDTDGDGIDNGPNEWFTISPLNKSYKKGERIYGDSHSNIEFQFKPNGQLPNDNQARYGIIRVRYNNFSCEHLIFVRQGYEPIKIRDGDNQARWSTFNMRTRSEQTASPCEEGSLFKRCCWDEPIDPTNNKTSSPFMTGPNPLKIYGSNETKNWDSWYIFPFDEWNNHTMQEVYDMEWLKPNVHEKSLKIATLEQYVALNNGSKVGTGVLYDGKATKPQLSVKDAYSYYYDYQIGQNGNGNGMRGTFIYDKYIGSHIFFPTGASGYGRRKQQNFNNYGAGFIIGDMKPGMLMYASRNTYMTASDADHDRRWTLFDIYRSPGAGYWIENEIGGKPLDDAGGWDFNYLSWKSAACSYSSMADTNALKEGNTVITERNGCPTDAVFIRCVVDE